MTSKWVANDRHHGTRHPTGEWVYFAINRVGEVGSLAGFVTPQDFRRLAKAFGVSSEVAPTVSPALTMAAESAPQLSGE